MWHNSINEQGSTFSQNKPLMCSFYLKTGSNYLWIDLLSTYCSTMRHFYVASGLFLSKVEIFYNPHFATGLGYPLIDYWVRIIWHFDRMLPLFFKIHVATIFQNKQVLEFSCCHYFASICGILHVIYLYFPLKMRTCFLSLTHGREAIALDLLARSNNLVVASICDFGAIWPKSIFIF